VLLYLNGFTSSRESPNFKFVSFSIKSGNFLSICIHAGESTTDIMMSYSKRLLLCHLKSLDIAGNLNVCLNLGMKGKCCSILARIDFELGM
jgi:hypothetical protein